MTEDYSGLGSSDGFVFPEDEAQLPDGVASPIIVYESDTESEHGPVIVLHELFGLSDDNLHFGSRLAQQGFKVYMPAVLGKRGAYPLKGIWACMGALFVTFKLGRRSPMSDWVRLLAKEVSRRHGGRRVGVVGMCMTGGIVFPVALEASVGAVVAAEPSLPFAFWPGASDVRKADLNLSRADIADIEAAREADRLAPLLTMRYRDDRICPAGRLTAARALFGAQDYPDLESGKSRDHSVLTTGWEDYHAAEPSSEQRRESEAAFAKVVDFLEVALNSP